MQYKTILPNMVIVTDKMTVKVVKCKSTKDCCFGPCKHCRKDSGIYGACSKQFRSDLTDVIFRKIEKKVANVK